MSELLKKYESIDQSKLNEGAIKILNRVKTITSDFTTDDAKNNKIADEVLNEIMKKFPDSVKIVKRTPKAKPAPKKVAKAKKTATTSTAKKSGNNIMSVAKEIQKAGESWKDAMERAKQVLKERREQVIQKQKTELEKLYALVKTKKELQGFAFGKSDIERDSVRESKSKGSRVVTREGFTSNQYKRNVPNKLGRKYWESRENRSDRLAPNYQKDMPLLASGGGVDEIENIDLGNNFEIKLEKLFYESGDFTYGTSLYYKNKLFKFFTVIPNATKKEAIDNVYKYLKTLSVSQEVNETKQYVGNKIEPLYTIFYNDRGGEHLRKANFKKEIEQFITDVNAINSKKFANGGSVNMDKHVWEGWTVGDFIEELEPTFNQIMSGRSWQKPFKTKEEVKAWAMDNQSYYKKNIPEVVNYFWAKAQSKDNYADGGDIKKLESSLLNAEKKYRKAILSEQVGIISPEELKREKIKLEDIRAKVNEWYATKPIGKKMADGGMNNLTIQNVSFAKGGKIQHTFKVGEIVSFPTQKNRYMDKPILDMINHFSNKELVIEKINEDKPYNLADVYIKETGEKLRDLILNPKVLKIYPDNVEDEKSVKIKDWYLENYPSDDLGEELNDEVTFEDMWNEDYKKYDIYQVMGVGDSLIRERLFEHLAEIKGVSYDVVYRKLFSNIEYAKGGSVSNERMYNFLQDDLQKLEESIKSADMEEVNRFFSYWLGSSNHLKSLETKTNERMYNFLKDDLEKLENAVENNDTEEVERFFSYWGQHLESLKMANGGSLQYLTDPNFGNFQNTGAFEKGGNIDGTMTFYQNDYDKLIGDSSEDYPFFSVKSGSYWEIKKDKDEKTVAKWFPKSSLLKITRPQDKDLVEWLNRNSYLSQDEYEKFELGGALEFSDVKKYYNENWEDLKSKGYSPLQILDDKAQVKGIKKYLDSGEIIISKNPSGHYVTWAKNSFELGGAFMTTDLAGHSGGGTGGLNANLPLSGVSGTYYTGLVGETGTMSSGELFMDGGAMAQNQQLIDGASQSYANYYLTNDGISQASFKKGGVIKNQYKDRTDKDIWNSFSITQRQHFLKDHFEEIQTVATNSGVNNINHFGNLIGWANRDYEDLPTYIKSPFNYHTESGQYASGGVMEKNQQVIDDASQSYINYYLGEGASQGIYKDGGSLYDKATKSQYLEKYSKNGNLVRTAEQFDSGSWVVSVYSGIDISGEYSNEEFNKRIKKYFSNYENGGSIPNNYEGRTPANIWKIWTEEQREQFLIDHLITDRNLNKSTEDFLIQFKYYPYSNLPPLAKTKLRYHIQNGQYAKGGSIPNNYEGRTPEDVWNNWTSEQKTHFMQDHKYNIFGDRQISKEDREKFLMTKFKDLSRDLRIIVEDHVQEGQYAYGGKTKSRPSMRELYIEQIAYLTNTREVGVDAFAKEHNLTDSELSNLMSGLGRKMISQSDFITALVGNKNNPKQKEVIAFAKSDKAYKMADGGDLGYFDNMSEEEIFKSTVVFDNNGKSYDRYTVFTPDDSVFGMSEDAKGFNLYIGDKSEIPMGKHLGKKLTSVPQGIRMAVLNRMKEEYADGGALKFKVGQGEKYFDKKEKMQLSIGKESDIPNVYNVIWEDGEHSIYSADNINFFISKGIWKKLDKMADGGGIRSKEELKKIFSEKEAIVKNLTPKQIAEMWNENSFGVKEGISKPITIEEAKRPSMKIYLENLLIENELTEDEQAQYFAKGGFVATVEFNVGDIVWDKGNKTYGTVMNNFGDPINGDGGELRLDSDGMQVIFLYDKSYENRIGYNLVKLGDKGDTGKFTPVVLDELKASAERMIKYRRDAKDKEGVKIYQEIYKRTLDGEFDSMVGRAKATTSNKKGSVDYTYVPNKDVKELSVVVKGELKKLMGSDILDGVYVKNSAKSTAKVDVNAVFAKILKDAKEAKSGKTKMFTATDLKKLNLEMVQKLVEAGYTEQQIRNIIFGYAFDNEIVADNELEYDKGIFSYEDTYVKSKIEGLVEAQKNKEFAVGIEYPDFDWQGIIKKYKISSKPKDITEKQKGTSGSTENYYEVFVGENIVIGHNYGYKWLDADGKVLSNYMEEDKKVSDPTKQNAWQKERGQKAGFNGGWWTIISSKIEIIDDVLKTLLAQKGSYCKEIQFYDDSLPKTLKENKIDFADGGELNKDNVKVGDVLVANTGVEVKVVEFDPKFGGRIRAVRLDEYATGKASQFMPLNKFTRKTNSKMADGGFMNNVYSHGGQMEVNDINSELEDFDLDNLDPFETMQYENYSKSMSKVDALQVLINTVEGDYSQLSPELAELAEMQISQEQWDEASREMYGYANGGFMNNVYAKGGSLNVGEERELKTFVNSLFNRAKNKIANDKGNSLFVLSNTVIASKDSLGNPSFYLGVKKVQNSRPTYVVGSGFLSSDMLVYESYKKDSRFLETQSIVEAKKFLTDKVKKQILHLRNRSVMADGGFMNNVYADGGFMNDVYADGGNIEKGSTITLKNDVYASYTNELIPKGTKLRLIATPPKVYGKNAYFVYAKTLDNKEEIRTDKSNFVEKIKELESYFADGGELKGKFLAEIKVPYNFEDVVENEFEFTEFLSKVLTKKWFGNGIWGVKIVKPLFERDYSKRIVVEIEIPVGVTQGGGLDKFDVGEFISKTLTKKWFGNGIWGVDIVRGYADGGFMNNVYAKGGGVEDISKSLSVNELYDQDGNLMGYTIKDKYNVNGKYTLSKTKERAEENLQYLIDNPSRLAYYRKNEYADGGMFEENDGFMRADNEFNYRYPTKDVYIETLDEPIDLTSTVTIKSNEVVISPIDENIDLNDDNRIRAIMTQSNRGSAENFGKINPRAFEFIDLPMPTSNKHKND